MLRLRQAHFRRKTRQDFVNRPRTEVPNQWLAALSGVLNWIRPAQSRDWVLPSGATAGDGTMVLRHNRTAGSAGNIVTVYPDLTAPAQLLGALAGKAINGARKLKVRDLAAIDVGTLNSWEIDFRAS